MTEQAPRSGSTRARRRPKGEQLMVPRAEFRSYYGRPVIKAPSWAARDIAGYFFLGGLAGGRLGARRGRPADRPHDAGRHDEGVLPGRRVPLRRRAHQRPGPPGPLRPHAARAEADLADERGLLAARRLRSGGLRGGPVRGHRPHCRGPAAAATAAAAVLGPAVATYTAVLAADTAVPAWHGAHRELPYLFAASATAAASGMALVLAPAQESAPARCAAVLAAVADSVAVRAAERRLGMVAETYREGRAGRLLRGARVLTGGGAALAALGGRRHRAAAVAGGLALLAGFGLHPLRRLREQASPPPRTRPTRSCLNEPPKGCCRHTENSNAPPPLCVPGRSPVSRQSTTSSTGASARAVRSQRTVTVVRPAA